MMQLEFGRHFDRHSLDGTHVIFSDRLPEELISDSTKFAQLFSMRPVARQSVRVRGRRDPVAIPRRQAAFGADYAFSGIVVKALKTPDILKPYLDWARQAVDARMNGLLLNWYDGPDEYIGRHRDEKKDLFEESPILTIAFGEEREFRMRPKSGRGFKDFPFPNGSFFVIPYATNLVWTHEVRKRKKYRGRRLSITIRCFARGVVDETS